MLPKLIEIGGFYLPTYGVLVAIAFLVAIWLTGKLAAKAGTESRVPSQISPSIAPSWEWRERSSSCSSSIGERIC